MPEFDVNGDDVEDDCFDICDEYISEEFRDIIGNPSDEDEIDIDNPEGSYLEDDNDNDNDNIEFGDLYE